MKVLVAGATGVLGTEIVRRLRGRGHEVRALVRSTSAPEKTARLRGPGVTIVEGDLKDPASLAAACGGVNAVISGAGTMSLIDAALAVGARHFVFVSFDTSVVPKCPLTAAKREAEDHLKRSGLTYSILHPSLFMESWLGPMVFADLAAGTAKVYGEGNAAIRYVAVSNVADLAVLCLTTPAAIGRGSGREVLRGPLARRGAWSRLGHPAAVRELPDEDGDGEVLRPTPSTRSPNANVEIRPPTWRGERHSG